tara:strand:- start:27856 stop:28263 length:408 start_codon:yes stop_codon:yes gene_type:complete
MSSALLAVWPIGLGDAVQRSRAPDLYRRARALALGQPIRRNTDMTKFRLLAASLIACTFLSSCGTTNAVRWAYGKTSVFEAPSKHSEEMGLRPIAGIPLIATAFVFDAVTFPAQALFGVWPWWGSRSLHMQPGSM